nr:lipid kinase YegS [Vibrio sp. CK2-1]
MDIRLILNGKKAGIEMLRQAIFQARESGRIDVRVTWEGGDVERFVSEAIQEGCQRIMIGGGDGSVKEVVDAMMKFEEAKRPELAILPLGTANDFATACDIPNDYSQALSLALNGQAVPVDCIKANDEHFMNVASGGFGAYVTANTPVELKNFLGGGAYTLHGLLRTLDFKPNDGILKIPDQTLTGRVIVSAVCNGRQAGGGQQLAPNAKINDGLMDVVAWLETPAENLIQTIKEMFNPELSGEYVKRFSVPWAEWESESPMPINLDGEPIETKRIRFEVVPKAIKLVLPASAEII